MTPKGEDHYPKVKEAVESKPWTPWITADRYKRGKNNNVQTTSPAQK